MDKIFPKIKVIGFVWDEEDNTPVSVQMSKEQAMEHHNEEFVWIVSWNSLSMSFFNFEDAMHKINELMIQGEKSATITTSI